MASVMNSDGWRRLEETFQPKIVPDHRIGEVDAIRNDLDEHIVGQHPARDHCGTQMMNRHHRVAEVREVRHAGAAGAFEGVVVGGGMAAGDDDSRRHQLADAGLGPFQLRRKRHFPDRRDRMEPLHERGIGKLQVGGVLCPGHFAVEERTFEMNAQAGRAFALGLVALR